MRRRIESQIFFLFHKLTSLFVKKIEIDDFIKMPYRLRYHYKAVPPITQPQKVGCK